MNEWQEYARRLSTLPPDQQEAEIAKLSPDQRRALEEARAAGVSFPPPPPPLPPPPPRQRKVWPWIVGCGCLSFVILGVLFTIGIFSGGGVEELERQGREYRLEQEQQEVQEQAAAATEISAVDLVRRYDANEIAADQLFKGKLLLVDGIVEDIGKDILDTMYVSLDGPEDSFRSAQCYFPKRDTEILARLSPGQHVRLLGRCEGLFMNVQIKDCQVKE